MAQRYELKLTVAQRQELLSARRRHAKAYVREKAAAILKVAEGNSIRQVALHGLLQRRRPETVRDWLSTYQQAGLAGLLVQTGRGRKAAFFPSTRQRHQRSSRTP